jgi:predicted chitinase
MFQSISPSFSPTDDFMKYTNEYAKKFNVCSYLKMAHFLAQISHESQFFTKTVEGMYYTEPPFLDTYKNTRTPNGVDFNNRNTYKHLLKNSIALANWRYGYLNKNNQQVDHRGRGYIHITWKGNYEAYTTYYQSEHNDTTIDFTETPKKLENMPYAMEAAFYYWHTRCLGKENVGNKVIEDSKLTMDSSLSEHLKVVKKVTYAVNGGYNGLKDRKDKFELIFNYLKGVKK